MLCDEELRALYVEQVQSVLRMWIFKHKYRHFRSLFAPPTSAKEVERHTLLHLGTGKTTRFHPDLAITATPHERILSDADVERIDWLKKGVCVLQLVGSRPKEFQFEKTKLQLSADSGEFKFEKKNLQLSADCKKIMVSGTSLFSSSVSYQLHNCGMGIGHSTERFVAFKHHADMDMCTDIRSAAKSPPAPSPESCFSLLLSASVSVDLVAPQPDMLSAKDRARTGSTAINSQQKTSVDALLGDGQDAPSGYVMADCYLALQAIVLPKESPKFQGPRDFAWIQTKARIAEVCAQLNLQPHELLDKGWMILKSKLSEVKPL
jgi:hypothetical protein